MDIRTKRLKAAFEKSGLTQSELCEKAGINKGAFSSYLVGRYFPKQKALEKLSSVLNVSIKYLMGIDEEIVPDPDLSGLTNISYPAARGIPILGTICAGNGVFCEENYDGEFFLDRSVKADLCLKIKGDSMVDAGIHDGDYVFIQKVYDYEDGKMYAVRINGDTEAVIKVLHRQGDSVVLCSRNIEYKPLVEPAENVSVIGECVGVYHSV